MERTRASIIAIALLLVLFFGINIFADIAFKGARLDLTENNLYTVSEGTRSIVRSLDEPITLTLFFSDSLADGRPSLQAYGKRVRELLEEYERISGNRITLEVLDPEPFSEAEERAQRAGISAIPIGAGEEFYFGLLGTNSTDGREVIPFFDPAEERFLEYEISRLIYKLSDPARPTVGIITSLPLDGRAPTPGMPQQQSRPWQIMRELRELFEVRMLPTELDTIDPGVDLLLLIHPKELSEQTLRAIDSYVIGGGPAVVCVDPMCEADIPPGAAQNPQALFSADRSSDLKPLLEAWGLDFTDDMVVLDTENAMRGRSPEGGAVVPYPWFMALDDEDLDQEDPVTLGLSRLQIGLVGALEPLADATATWQPLVYSSEQSMEMLAARFTVFADPQQIMADFAPSGERKVLAGRLTGPATSAYEEGDSGEPEEDEAGADEAGGANGARTGEIRVVVFADVDMFADRMWVEEMRLGNTLLGYRKLSDNADLLVNVIDNLAGTSDLLRIRARGAYTRPFTLVEKIRARAEKQYLSEAQELQEQRRQTERRLQELQRARPESGEVILTPEQQAELEKFREQLATTNAQLRQVRYKLREDVEELGMRLKIINTVAAPALVALGAIGLGLYRAARRRADRRSVAERSG